MSWRLNEADMWLLGKFEPDLDIHLGVQLTLFLQKRLSNWDHLDIRPPLDKYSVHRTRDLRGVTNMDLRDDLWHHDNDSGTLQSQNLWMATWSNESSTEIRRPFSSRIYQPRPCEMVMFHNLVFEHRRPRVKSQARWDSRWFVRVAVPNDGRVRVRDVPGVFALSAP